MQIPPAWMMPGWPRAGPWTGSPRRPFPGA